MVPEYAPTHAGARLRRRPARRAAERAGRARAGRARRARQAARRGRAAARRGGQLRARRPRAGDGGRRGGRRRRSSARTAPSSPGSCSTRAGTSACRDRRSTASTARSRATESFNRRNGNARSRRRSRAWRAILARADRPVTVTLSVAFGDPCEGEVDPGVVAALAERLGPTPTSSSSPTRSASRRPAACARSWSASRADATVVGGHFHDTRNTGVANVWAALEAGATVLDASVGGLGGCPFAPRATGNVATEDVVYLLEEEGVDDGRRPRGADRRRRVARRRARARAARPRLPRRGRSARSRPPRAARPPPPPSSRPRGAPPSVCSPSRGGGARVGRALAVEREAAAPTRRAAAELLRRSRARASARAVPPRRRPARARPARRRRRARRASALGRALGKRRRGAATSSSRCATRSGFVAKRGSAAQPGQPERVAQRARRGGRSPAATISSPSRGREDLVRRDQRERGAVAAGRRRRRRARRRAGTGGTRARSRAGTARGRGRGPCASRSRQRRERSRAPPTRPCRCRRATTPTRTPGRSGSPVTADDPRERPARAGRSPAGRRAGRRAEGADRAVDEARVARAGASPAPRPRRSAAPGRRLCDDDVGAVGEARAARRGRAGALRSSASERLPAFAAKNIDAAAREQRRPPVARLVARARPLDLDHVRTERGEHLRAGRPGEASSSGRARAIPCERRKVMRLSSPGEARARIRSRCGRHPRHGRQRARPRGRRPRACRPFLHGGARAPARRALGAPRGGVGDGRRADAHRPLAAAGRPRGRPRRRRTCTMRCTSRRALRRGGRAAARARPRAARGAVRRRTATSRAAYVDDPDGNVVELWTWDVGEPPAPRERLSGHRRAPATSAAARRRGAAAGLDVDTARVEVRDADAVARTSRCFAPDAVVHTAYRQDGAEAWSTNVDGSSARRPRRGRLRARASSTSPRTSSSTAARARRTSRRTRRSRHRLRPLEGRGRASVAAAHPDALLVRTSLIVGGPGAEPSKHELAARDRPRHLLHERDPLARPGRRPRGGAARARPRPRRRRRRSTSPAPTPSRGTSSPSSPPAAPCRPRPRRSTRPLDCTLDSSRAQAMLRTRLRGVRTVLA